MPRIEYVMQPRNTMLLLKRFAHFFVIGNCGDHGLEYIDEISTRSKIGNILPESRLFAATATLKYCKLRTKPTDTFIEQFFVC
jgi:hypothetical protein